MHERKILNSREVKQIRKLIEEQWGTEIGDYVFMQKGDDIFITSRDIERIPIDRLRVNSIGLYMGELRHGELRLSIEGSQIIGKDARRNIFELDDSQKFSWIKGDDIDTGSEAKGFVLIRYGNDFLGCGKIKDGRVINYYPKSRRVHADI